MSGPLAVIPARDEVVRLPHALGALHAQGVSCLVVANGCSDATAAVARRGGARVIETPALPGGVGEARALGMAEALKRPAPWLLTTDADCVLEAGTIAVLAAALGRADAAFGRVEPDPGEFAALPRAVRLHGILESRRETLRARIEGLRAPRPWNPLPCHGQSPGALIAWRREAYAASGGFDPVPCHEDRRMAAALDAARLRVARPWDAVARVSCRLVGRAPSGMASTIADRTRLDLGEEIRALERDCARLERRLAALTAPQPLPTF